MENKWNDKIMLAAIRQRVIDKLEVVGKFVEDSAKLLVPVDTENLQGSIHHVVDEQELSVRIGTPVEYACIFNAHTVIATKTGNKTIGQIKIGDKVLTQTGEYKRVIDKIIQPAINHPNMVDIEIEWRKGKTHKLTVTQEHKILVNRDGRNKWIEAGKLLEDDQLFSAIKIPVNKNTGKSELRTCAFCLQTFVHDNNKNLRAKYCSIECRNKAYATELNPHIGSKRSEQSKEKMSKSAKIKFINNPELHPNRIMNKKGFKTKAEKDVEIWLKNRGIKFLAQYKIGNLYVDYYDPETNTIYEADGAYWHRHQAKDIERDKQLLSIDPTLTIQHIHFYDQRFSKIDNPKPFPNVTYVVCNPDVNGYVNPNLFEGRKIVSIKKWTYGTKNHRNDPMIAKIYDLSIEGIHSYYANGILVSNSYIEFGTGEFAENGQGRKGGWFYVDEKGNGHFTLGNKPQPFLRPALLENKETIKKMLEL